MMPGDDPAAPVKTARRSLGQLILCQGCCCGRTDRGFPEVPVDRIKAEWKSGKLNRTVQLTISGCVGPCDVANVVVLVRPEGNLWLGKLGTADYDDLIAWARGCHGAGALAPLPDHLLARRFEWLGPPAAPAAVAGSPPAEPPPAPGAAPGLGGMRLFGAGAGREPGRAAEVKGWVGDLLGLGQDDTVLVAELRCSEPGCPPLETTIAVLPAGGGSRQFKIHKSLAELTFDCVRAACVAG